MGIPHLYRWGRMSQLESLKEIVIPKDSLNKDDINRLSNKGIEVESYDGTKIILH